MHVSKVPEPVGSRIALDAITAHEFNLFIFMCRQMKWAPHIFVRTPEQGLAKGEMKLYLWAFDQKDHTRLFRSFDVPEHLQEIGWKIHATDVLERLYEQDLSASVR